MDIHKFREWLEAVYDRVDGLFEPHEQVDQSSFSAAALIVSRASEWARRLGAPEVVYNPREFLDGGGCCGRDEAKNALALMLKWVREYEREQIPTLPWLSTRQAAIYLQASEDFIRARCNDGTLPHQRVGREYRIKRTDLDRVSVADDW